MRAGKVKTIPGKRAFPVTDSVPDTDWHLKLIKASRSAVDPCSLTMSGKCLDCVGRTWTGSGGEKETPLFGLGRWLDQQARHCTVLYCWLVSSSYYVCYEQNIERFQTQNKSISFFCYFYFNFNDCLVCLKWRTGLFLHLSFLTPSFSSWK